MRADGLGLKGLLFREENKTHSILQKAYCRQLMLLFTQFIHQDPEPILALGPEDRAVQEMIEAGPRADSL